mmetsp:Transcript_122257/g.391008  ORF Transcript_122257/g.391008 Transcript_122257/m.391008 type:complete len:364 (+) Transcript_122257:854-1945(+)
MLSSNWMPTSSSSDRHPSWRRCSPCTRLEPLPCSSTCLTRSTNRDSKMCCAPRVTFPCRTSPVHSTRRCATVGATTSVWRCSTSSSEVRTYAFAPLLASGSLRISSFLICLRFRQSGSRGKQKPDVAEKDEDKQTEQGDRCLDAGITNDGHQQGHGSQQAAPGQLHGTHPAAAMPSAIEKQDNKETEQGDLCSDTRIAIDGHQGGHASQQATPGQLRGTPPVAATPLALPDLAAGSNRSDEQSLASSKSSVSLAGAVLLNPTLMGTWDLAKDLTLMETISRWNVHVSKTSCYPLHCATMEASKSLKRLMRKGCSVGFHLDGNRQCRQCGLLGDGGGCCLEECTKHGRCKACFSADFVGTKTSL